MLPTSVPVFIKKHRLFILIGLSGLAYLLAAFWFPLLPYFNRVPLRDVRSFTPSLPGGLAYGGWLLLLFALYAGAVRAGSAAKRPLRLRFIWLSTCLIALPLLFTYPINATDVYRYYLRGRITTQYGENPFTTPPATFTEDPYLPLADEWADQTTPYGPLWEMVAAGVAFIAGENLLLGLILFKGWGLLIHLGISGLLWHLLAEQETAVRQHHTLLWAWNPALLLTFVSNAHNDALVLFWLLLGWQQVVAGHQRRGLLLMGLGPLTKISGVLALPPVLIAVLAPQNDWRTRLTYLLQLTMGGLAITLLLFLPFGSPLALAERLLFEASGFMGFSPITLVALFDVRFGWGWPINGLSRGLTGLFVILVIGLLWRGWHGRSPLRGIADSYGGYLLQAASFRLWYASWPLPWLLLDTENSRATAYRRRVGLWFLLTTQLSVIIYGHLRVFWFGGHHFWAHLVAIPFTFGLPFLLAKLSKNE